MMDSQENALTQGINEEEKAVQETTTQVDTAEKVSDKDTCSENSQKATHKSYKDKKEILARVKEIAHSDENPKKDEIDYLKTSFYKLHIAERDADMKAYLENGGAPENYQILPDEDEEIFKAEMQIIKEKKHLKIK